MRRLEKEEIEKLAERIGVKKIAVENFLMSMTNNESEKLARGNLFLDAQMYKWNGKTIKAISDGIKLASE